MNDILRRYISRSEVEAFKAGEDDGPEGMDRGL
jgi:hypothetical protein